MLAQNVFEMAKILREKNPLWRYDHSSD